MQYINPKADDLN